MRALSALGLPLEKPSFPTILNCPVCDQKTLHLFDDISADGVWLHCTNCTTHGDIITFGAELWKLSLPDTLAKFRADGAISKGEETRAAGEYSRFLTRYGAAQLFWEEAATQVWNHDDDLVAARLRQLGLRHEIDAGVGMVGVAHKDQVDRLCAALGRPKPPRSRPGGAYIVFPFYDLPRRLTGFMLLQYNDACEPKQNFVPVSGFRRDKPEAGYFLLDALLTGVTTPLKSTQIISDDFLWVLEAQCRRLTNGAPYLPILASYSGNEAESYGISWRSFGFAERVFHSRAMLPNLVSRACNAKGYVATCDTQNRWRRSSLDDLRLAGNIRRAAETWQTALHRTLTGMSEISAATFAAQLRIPHEKLNVFFNKHEKDFSPGFHERAMASLRTALAAPVRVQRRRIIVEREDGWWSKTGGQICNARPVISEVLQADTGEKLYRGYVNFDDTIIDFCDSAKKIENMGLLAYAAATMAAHGKLVIFDRQWNKTAHMAAIQLRPPKLTAVSTKYGWDDAANVFRFPNYEITSSGDVRPVTEWPGAISLTKFPEPTAVAPLPIRELLTPAHENSFVWAVFAAFVANLVAPIARKPFCATALTAKNFVTAQRIVTLLGGQPAETASTVRRSASNFLQTVGDNADWPAICVSTFNDNAFNLGLAKVFNTPVFVRLSKANASAVLSYGWQKITGFDTRQSTDLTPLKYLLPTYLRRVLTMRGQLFASTENLTIKVLNDLHSWLQHEYGTSFNLGHTRRLIETVDDAHTALLKELNYAVANNKLTVLPQPRNAHQNSQYLLRQKNCWWLNRKAVDRYFDKEQAINPNWLQIVTNLQTEGVYTGEEVVQNMHGIFVSAEWCDQFFDGFTPSLEKEIG